MGKFEVGFIHKNEIMYNQMRIARFDFSDDAIMFVREHNAIPLLLGVIDLLPVEAMECPGVAEDALKC